jgi:hypothetical protein
VNWISFVRKHGLLVLVVIELVAAAALTGWLLTGLVMRGA